MRDTNESTICLEQTGAAGNEESSQQNQPPSYSVAKGISVLITTPLFKVAGIVQDIQPHGLSILVKQPLAEGRAAIEFGAMSVYGEIVSCRPMAGKYEVSVVTREGHEPDLRSADRYPLSQEVWIHADSLPEPLAATVVNVSMYGVGLETSAPLRRGEIVTLETGSSVAFGIVRHCEPLTDGHFQAGLEVFHTMPKGV